MDDKKNKASRSQFQLLRKKQFAPFFWTQFFGAFNDNIFKNALLLLFSYHATVNFNTDILNNLAAALFILPFFILSAIAGQIADKYEKSSLIRRIKFAEICIMIAAAIAFYFESLYALLIILFFMGTQSTFFGPVKYSILPQHLREDELVGGNGLVEMGTFVAILLGTILAGELIQLENKTFWITATIISVAFLGWIISLFIPSAKPDASNIKISLNIFSKTWQSIQFARKERSVFLSVLGISWFWMLGASYLTQFPNFTKIYLQSDEGVVTLLLAMFSIGVALGSLLCERLSGHKVELGLVPLGSIGLSIFGIDLFFAQQQFALPITTELLTRTEFIASGGSLRILIDLVCVGFFGGFYTVPLYALIQSRTEKSYLARVIAANNILNALFLVASALLGIVILSVFNLSIPMFFLIIAGLNILVAAYIYTLVPEFLMRFLIWMLTHTMYRVKHQGLDHIPDEGPAVLVCNHVSYVDALIIGGACRRPVRFVMYEPIFRIPILKFIFKTGKAIPITSKNENPVAYEQAFDVIAQALEDGDIICIFPEGKLTKTGEMGEFKPGIEKIINRTPVPVVPMALKGLWGSYFSHHEKSAFAKLPKRFWSKINVVAGESLQPNAISAEKLHHIVSTLRDGDS